MKTINDLPPIQMDILRSIRAHKKPAMRHLMAATGMNIVEGIEFHLCRLREAGMVEPEHIALTKKGREAIR